MASIRSGIGENMEDRYLFKAKHFEKWHIGNIVKEPDGLYIRDIKENVMAYIDDESTICQCTGLKDKNGKLIWENDIVKDIFSDTCAPIKYGSYQNCFDNTKAEHIGFYVDWSGKYTKRYRKDLGYWINMVNAEIIGNIFDNPELLESER